MADAGTETRGLFVTGTDTGVGKTYVAALIARELVRQGRSVGAYKPACSGAIQHGNAPPVWEDVEVLADAIGGADHDRLSPQRFLAPLAPYIAASREAKSVDSRLLRTGADWWLGRVEILLVEGAGGLLSPITPCETIADLAKDIEFPLVIVARLGLGTINHTLLTLEAARQRQLPVAGIVLNEGDQAVDELTANTNYDELVRLCEAPILGVVRRSANSMEQLDSRQSIDWWSLADRTSSQPTA